MKAVLFDRDPEIRVGDVPDLEPGDDEVLVQVGACGICASELHVAGIKDFDLPYPFVAGHEAAGVVAKVGKAVTNVEPGAHVAVQPAILCGTCRFCRSGHANLCQAPRHIGLHRPGGFAEYVAAPAANVHASGDLPDAASSHGPRGKLRLSDSDLKPTIEEALRHHGGNVAAAARHLDTSRMQVHRWMKKLGIDPNLFRS